MNKQQFTKQFVDEFLSLMELEGECLGVSLNDDILPFVMNDTRTAKVILLLSQEDHEDACYLLDSIIDEHKIDAALKYAEFSWSILENNEVN
ncbi:MAG: hypothetical protein KUG81_05840 [Gammaproteobacteria bacterium]|nr:hypothetical protein [Gammaproteobacteria bacterium]